MPSKFGQLLLWGNLITPEQLEHALNYQREHAGKLGEILNKLGYITDDDVTRTLGMKYGTPTVNLEQLQLDPDTLGLVPSEMARKHRVIPLERAGATLTCAMEDPTRIDIVDEIEFQTGCRVQPVLVTPAMMSAGLDRYYPVTPQAPAVKNAVAHRNSRLIADITHRLEHLPADKLEYVRRFLDSIG